MVFAADEHVVVDAEVVDQRELLVDSRAIVMIFPRRCLFFAGRLGAPRTEHE